MIQALQTPITFDEFIEWLPESSESRYELRRGKIIEMPKPRGKHSEVAGFAIKKLNQAIDAAHLPYFIPKECIVKLADDTGYEPDVIVLDRTQLLDEPRWERESIITLGKSIKLVIEVVSTNWDDDYIYKLGDYQALGVQEYWIVDYLGLGGRLYIGNPKRPTVSIYDLVEAEYEVSQFRGSDRLVSPLFGELDLTANQLFAAGWEHE
ncbi:Uma2 family endonuclease [Thermoleptolyngbya sp. M55_K2018_002]|uniref:Uma2 family endonuclease n=1 Tax=Thermoleptolyngbya sp. M55_K2018_002 TaxID=2747808 RepID=UPI001A067011|nr:Uma2 family endonuclease [Thermoleptolyngbya sp. M55_K2018_002]HIK39765.1 Uma2 family endonuclease [Thermoleptolyngbya sp. M55_K2018_002]